MNKLQEACILSHEHWLKEIEQSIASIDIDIPEIKIPEKKKDKQSKNKKNGKISKKVVKVLIIAAIIVSLLMTASAYKPFREFIVECFDNYNLFTNDDYEMHYPKEIEVINLPEGFVLVESNATKHIMMQKYICDKQMFMVSKNTPDAYIQISNTYLEEKVFYNEDVKYSLFKINDECTEIVWLTNEYSYVLTGFNMTNEELIEIAKGIK